MEEEIVGLRKEGREGGREGGEVGGGGGGGERGLSSFHSRVYLLLIGSRKIFQVLRDVENFCSETFQFRVPDESAECINISWRRSQGTDG